MAITINDAEKISSTQVRLHTNGMHGNQECVVRVSNVEDADGNVIDERYQTAKFSTKFPSYIIDDADLMTDIYSFVEFDANTVDFIQDRFLAEMYYFYYYPSSDGERLYGSGVYCQADNWLLGDHRMSIHASDNNYRYSPFSAVAIIRQEFALPLADYPETTYLWACGNATSGTGHSWEVKRTKSTSKWTFALSTYNPTSVMDSVELDCSLAQDQWVMLVVTWDAAVLKIWEYNFATGVLNYNSKVHTQPGSMYQCSQPLYCNRGFTTAERTGLFHARINYSPVYNAWGRYECLGFWKRVLGPTDIAKLINSGAGLPFSYLDAI